MFQYSPSSQPALAPIYGQPNIVLGDVEFVILELLSRDALTGLDLLLNVQYLQQQLGGQFTFKKGDLHPTLKSLVAAGLVLRSSRILPDGLERTYLQLTHAGRQALDAA